MHLGIEIGGTKLQVVLGNASGIKRRWRGTVNAENGGAGICEQLDRALAKLLEANVRDELQGAGVGFGGPIDVRSGRILRSHQIHGWENFPLRDWLSDRTKTPVAVDNDANVAALGEAKRGAGAGSDPVLYVTLGSGVGGGLVRDGAIYHGAPPGEAEFGHIRLDREGATVESRCSGWAVDARLREAARREPKSPLGRLLQGKSGAEARYLSEACASGDKQASKILLEIAEDLGFALSHAVHLFHPAVIVLGGGLSLVGEPLREAVAKRLPAYLMKAFLPAPHVRLAGLGEDAVTIGALELAAGTLHNAGS